MTSARHAALGAAVAVLPDVALVLFGWRKRWLPESHLLVRAHRWLHSPNSIWFIAAVAWGSHIAADKMSPHREGGP